MPVTASPHPRQHHTPQEMQGNTCNDMSSKGAFLLTALLESNCATPVRFWGSKPLFISAFLADRRTHACPPLLSNHGPSQRPGFCLFSHSGGSFHALGTPSPPKHTFQCAFLLLYVIPRFEIHLVRNTEHYQLSYHCCLTHIKGCSASQARLLPMQPSVHSFTSWLASFRHAEKLRRVALGVQQEPDVMFPTASFQHLSKSRLLQKVLK